VRGERHSPAFLRAVAEERLMLQPGAVFPGDGQGVVVRARVEDQPLAVKVLRETDDERVELREYRYAKVEITLCKGPDGRFTEAARDLVAYLMGSEQVPLPAGSVVSAAGSE